MIELFTEEFQQEAATTRRLLERVPQEFFDWKPHDKSMTLGELAGHVANLHGTWLQTTLTEDHYDLAEWKTFKAESVSEILEAFDQSIARANEVLSAMPEESLSAPWRLKYGDAVVFELPRWTVMRSMVANHIIHHRGQLSVYLRLRDVPLPPMYGPTADEAPSF